MKVCNIELIRMIKSLENEKNDLVRCEQYQLYTEYGIEETPEPSTFNYKEFVSKINRLDLEIQKYKHILNKINNETVIPEFDLTIDQALVHLTQLNAKLRLLSELVVNPHRRRGAGESLVFIDANYDVEEVKKDIVELRKTISNLQMAIDRCNINNFIDI